MKVLIVMVLVTVIAYGSTLRYNIAVNPNLKCLACLDETGQLFCRHPEFIELKECSPDAIFCMDIVHKEWNLMHKDCVTEKELNEIKQTFGNSDVIVETCCTSECNTKKWEDYV